MKFDQEIISTFHDGNRIGFVFDGGDSGHKYLMKVYNTGGKNTMQKYFDLQYNSITLQKDKIVLFNEKEFAIYKLNGQKTFQGKYRKPECAEYPWIPQIYGDHRGQCRSDPAWIAERKL